VGTPLAVDGNDKAAAACVAGDSSALDQMWQLAPDEQKERLRVVQQQWHVYLCQLGALIGKRLQNFT
jgi:hypothetical protein